MADHQETWTLKGLLDMGCALCERAGVKMTVEIEVGLDVTFDEHNTPHGRIEMLNGDLPVRMECVNCGNVVLYQDSVQGAVA